MYHKTRYIQMFCPLGRFAPVAVNSGLRPRDPQLHHITLDIVKNNWDVLVFYDALASNCNALTTLSGSATIILSSLR